MGINSIGKIASTAVRQARQFGGRNITKTFITDAMKSELKLAPATQAVGDVWHFTPVDPSLNPEFLKSLLEIKGEPIEKTQKMVDEMLKAMGYKKPCLKVIQEEVHAGDAGFRLVDGSLLITTDLIKYSTPQEVISMLRHELEHTDQHIKIFKSKGKDAFVDAFLSQIVKRFKNSPLLADNGQELINTWEKEILNTTNFNFYEEMAKQATLEGFDIEKYFIAMKNYTNGLSFAKRYEYFNNALEKSAYQKGRQVLKALGVQSTVFPDIFPQNYKKISNLMTEQCMSAKEQDDLLCKLEAFINCQSLHTISSKLKKAIKLIKREYINDDLTEIEKIVLRNIGMKYCDFTPKDINIENCQSAWTRVESLMKDGKFKLEEILPEL